jgi:hypothetical protein
VVERYELAMAGGVAIGDRVMVSFQGLGEFAGNVVKVRTQGKDKKSFLVHFPCDGEEHWVPARSKVWRPCASR